MAWYGYIYVNHAYIYNWSALSCYLTIAVLNDCYSEVTAYSVLGYFIGLVSTTRVDAYAVTLTNDITI